MDVIEHQAKNAQQPNIRSPDIGASVDNLSFTLVPPEMPDRAV